MNIYPLNNINTKSYYGLYSGKPNFVNDFQKNSINFKCSEFTQEQYDKAKEYADKYNKTYSRLYNYGIQDLDMDKLNGIQKDISVFDGMSMKEIFYTFRNFGGILTKRGCPNQCAHCYISAMPPIRESGDYINSIPFEDYVNILDGIQELNKRIGVSVFSSNEDVSSSISLFLDTDCMEIALRDRSGKIHEVPELIDKYNETLGHRFIFDTASWNQKNSFMQDRAERYVKYLSDPINDDKLAQINLSLSPFHSIYKKATELGYNPVTKEATGEKADLGKKMYDNYIDRMSNMLLTFSPLINNQKFSIISRPITDDVPNMTEYSETTYKSITRDITTSLKAKLLEDLNGEQKYVTNDKQASEILFKYALRLISTDKDIAIAGRFKELLNTKNPDMSNQEISNYFNGYFARASLKDNGKDYDKYLRYIDSNGRVILTDNKNVIKTELQLNLSSKDKKTRPFKNTMEDSVVTKSNVSEFMPYS